MKDTLSYIVISVVDNPEKVRIDEEEAEGVVNFSITTASEDIGKVIGKEGRVIRAIRNIMKIPAMKQNKRISIVLADSKPQQQ